jgi:hypothetical protein
MLGTTPTMRTGTGGERGMALHAQTSSGPKAYVSRAADGRAARVRSKPSISDEAGAGCGCTDEDDMLEAKGVNAERR